MAVLSLAVMTVLAFVKQRSARRWKASIWAWVLCSRIALVF